jgi:hypothetical protein
MSDFDLLRAIRLLMDPSGGGLHITPQQAVEWVKEIDEENDHLELWNKKARGVLRAMGTFVCQSCRRSDRVEDVGFSLDCSPPIMLCKACKP